MSPELDRWLALLIAAACALCLVRSGLRSAARFLQRTRLPGTCGGCGGGCGDKPAASSPASRGVKLERFLPR